MNKKLNPIVRIIIKILKIRLQQLELREGIKPPPLGQWKVRPYGRKA